MSSNAILLRLSESDMAMLDTLATKQGLAKSEYLRLIIQTIYIAETTSPNDKGAYKFNFGEYGFTLDKEFIEQYAKELEGFFVGIEKRMEKVLLSQTKRNKEVRIRRVVKPKKVA
jgi:predicted DNA-binding protein